MMLIRALGPDFFDGFASHLADAGLPALRNGLIGKDVMISGPWGERPLIYADYVASGRALMQVEALILRDVLPYYANSHTQASHCGASMTRLRAAARDYIARCCDAPADDFAVIFSGAGATAGINRLIHLLGVRDAMACRRPVRIVNGPYEHHSNILPWRDSGAEIVTLPEAETGGPDMAKLEEALATAPEDALVIGAFSAASNVTGALTDIAAVTRLLNRQGALAVWDYAGGGPYLPISMRPAPDARIDAVVASPHKFAGGPGASGVTIVRRAACSASRPSQSGGGTVTFVSPWDHDYSARLEAREEAGTPNVIGDIRAGLAFAVKSAIGRLVPRDRHTALARRALTAWRDCPRLMLLGDMAAPRLPIVSFRIADDQGGHVHHQLVTRLLSDRYGIQARGGCACAGPYVHALLDLDRRASDDMRRRIAEGNELAKPGFVRLNFSVLMDEGEVDAILSAVRRLAIEAADLADLYDGDPATAIFTPRRSLTSSLPNETPIQRETAPQQVGDD